MKTRVMRKKIVTMAATAMLSAGPVLAQPGAGAPAPGTVPGGIPGGLPDGIPGALADGLPDPFDLPPGLFDLPAGTGVLAGPGAIDWSEQREDREQERAQRDRQRETERYDSGLSAMDDDRWDRALEQFSRVVDMNGSRVDAAKYWKAYAQNRLGQRAESLATIAELIKSHPSSRYVSQAKQLEADVRSSTGQPGNPETQADEDMKRMAINALQHQDPERAVPILEKLLAGNNTPKIEGARAVRAGPDQYSRGAPGSREDRARRGQPRPSAARDPVPRHPRRKREPCAAGRHLQEQSDVDVKRRILQAFMVSGERARLLEVAQSEAVAELRGEAVQPARQDGRARRALAALHQRIVARRQAADSAGDVRRRERRTAPPAREDRERS